MLEVALGGPDRAARLTLLQHVLRIPTTIGSYSYADLTATNPLIAFLQGQGFTYDPDTCMLTSTATLQVTQVTTSAPASACEPSTQGGYLAADNQMIRVAINSYDGKSSGNLVWGFNNASFLYRATLAPGQTPIASQPLVLAFQNPPIDPNHQPQSLQAVEILRCTTNLDAGSPGFTGNSVTGNYIAAGSGVVAVLGPSGATYDPSKIQLTLPAGLPQPFLGDLSIGLPLFVRLWQGQIAFTSGAAVALGNTGLGVTITLPPVAVGPPSQPFPALPGLVGNPPFWQFAVRPSTPQQVYPQRYRAAPGAAPQPPEGPRQAMAILGIANWTVPQTGAASFTNVNNSSVPFKPLSQLTPPSANPSAFHVKNISWVNDDVSTIDMLILKGLTVTLDNAPSGPIDSRNFLVTLRMPFDSQLAETLINNPTLVFPPPVALVGSVTAEGDTLTWLPAPPASQMLEVLSGWMDLSSRTASSGSNMEARVTLKGHAITGITIKGAPAWLDGQCFGVHGLRLDGTPRIDLNLSNNVLSGAGVKASDFESWFQVAPVPTLSLPIQPSRRPFDCYPRDGMPLQRHPRFHV